MVWQETKGQAMIAYLSLSDIETEPWSQQLSIDPLLGTINTISKTYNNSRSMAHTAMDYLNLQQILLSLNGHYRQLLLDIHTTYYGFLSHFIAIDRLLKHYASLANFGLRLKKEAIWLAHRLALLLNTKGKSYFEWDTAKVTLLSSLDRAQLTQAYGALLKQFDLKLNFLA